MDIEREMAWLVAQQYRRRARALVVVEFEPDKAFLRELPKLKIVEALQSCPSIPKEDAARAS
jgi:hypothetical protein